MKKSELKVGVRYVRKLLLQLADDFGDAALEEKELDQELHALSEVVAELEQKLHQFQNS